MLRRLHPIERIRIVFHSPTGHHIHLQRLVIRDFADPAIGTGFEDGGIRFIGTHLCSELDIDATDRICKIFLIMIPTSQRLDQYEHPVTDRATKYRFLGRHRIDVDGVAVPCPASKIQDLLLRDYHVSFFVGWEIHVLVF